MSGLLPESALIYGFKPVFVSGRQIFLPARMLTQLIFSGRPIRAIVRSLETVS
jgi:hypothetical protein